MIRFLKGIVALLCVSGLYASAQMTTITASDISMGGTPIAAGTVTFTPVNMLGIPIPFAQGGGGLNAPMAYSCTITNGALSGCSIPDSSMTTPANILYSIQITNTGNQKTFTLQTVPNISGATWALDRYAPPATTTNVQTMQSAYGTSVPVSCVSPSIFTDSVTKSLYQCVGGEMVQVGNLDSPRVIAMPQRANLLGEYLLNEGTGTVADDTSGKGNNATISGATWDGTADLNFNVTGDYIQLPIALNQANTFQFVVYVPPMGTAVAPLPPGYGDSTQFPANGSLLCGTDTAHTCLIASSLYGPVSHRFFAFNTDNTESREYLPVGWHVVTLVNGIAPDKDHWYFDGAEVSSYVTQGSGAITHPAMGNYQIGGSSTYTQSWWRGKVAAAWAWSTALSPNDVAAAAKSALDYARAKGAVEDYRAAVSDSPLIIGGLDSRTYGIGTAHPWITSMTLTDSTYTTLNLGESGMRAIDGATMFSQLYGTHIARDSAPSIVVLWGGINDMLNSNATTQQIASALRSMVSQAKADGARVILATEIDATGADAKKDALDTMLRQQAYSWGVDSLADLATIPQLGADGAAANTTYFNSGLHPVDAGETLITSVMSNAVNELIGSTATNRHTTATATYQELAGDRFLDLTGTSAQTISLPDCIGYSLPREIVNLGTVASTVAPINSETLTGSTALAVNSRAVFVPVPGALTTGGCHWERTQ